MHSGTTVRLVPDEDWSVSFVGRLAHQLDFLGKMVSYFTLTQYALCLCVRLHVCRDQKAILSSILQILSNTHLLGGGGRLK